MILDESRYGMAWPAVDACRGGCRCCRFPGGSREEFHIAEEVPLCAAPHFSVCTGPVASFKLDGAFGYDVQSASGRSLMHNGFTGCKVLRFQATRQCMNFFSIEAAQEVGLS